MCAKRAPSDHGGSSGTAPEARPFRNFLLLSPHLTLTGMSDIDYAAADPALLAQLAYDAETAMRTIHLGMAAMGHLLARSAPEIVCRVARISICGSCRFYDRRSLGLQGGNQLLTVMASVVHVLTDSIPLKIVFTQRGGARDLFGLFVRRFRLHP